MLLDHHVDTTFLHDLLFELSTGADVDQAINLLADPKRLIKKKQPSPNKTIADLDTYSLSLKAHTPVDPRTRVVGSFVAGTSRAAPTLSYPTQRGEKPPARKPCRLCRLEYISLG